jgi:hypothetical protein
MPITQIIVITVQDSKENFMKEEIDDELRGMAVVAIRDAFYLEFSALANKYVNASQCLIEEDDIEYELQDMTSVFGRDESAKAKQLLIYTLDSQGKKRKHKTMRSALKDNDGEMLYINNKNVFKRVKGEWHQAN